MSETQKKTRAKSGGLVPRVIAALIGWAVLTFFNFLPLWLEMPFIDMIKFGGNDANIMEEHTFEKGLFRKRLNETGNLSAGGALIYNDTSAYYTTNGVVCELDVDQMEYEILGDKAEYTPHFCDDRYYLSVGSLTHVGVGELGDAEPYLYDEAWYDKTGKWDDVRAELYTLLKKGESEELSTPEMAKLTGYTMLGSIVGFDGETAVFCYADEAGGRILFQFVNDGGLYDVLPASCADLGKVMMSGTTAIYTDGGLLKTFNLETLAENTLNDQDNPVYFVNHGCINNTRIVAWIAADGLHTLDLDSGEQQFIGGDFHSEYHGLYLWKNHIVALHNNFGFHNWNYNG